MLAGIAAFLLFASVRAAFGPDDWATQRGQLPAVLDNGHKIAVVEPVGPCLRDSILQCVRKIRLWIDLLVCPWWQASVAPAPTFSGQISAAHLAVRRFVWQNRDFAHGISPWKWPPAL